MAKAKMFNWKDYEKDIYFFPESKDDKKYTNYRFSKKYKAKLESQNSL